MRPRELWSLLVAASMIVACSEHPGGVTPQKVVVAPDTAVTMTLGQSVVVSATVDGRAVSVSVRLRTEQRWLDDRAVLDSVSLSAARLQARAPGRAVVEVTVGAHTDSFSVSVIPPRPSVVETRLPGGRVHLGDGDTITLRGYHMDQVTGANIAAGTAATTIVAQDSASLRFTISSAANAACTGTAERITLVFSGIDGDAVGGLTRKRAGELTLAPGAALRLTDAQAACVRLAPANGADYLLAYADTRLVTNAQSAPEFPWPDGITVRVADQSTTSVPSAIDSRLNVSTVRDAPSLADEHPAPTLLASSIPASCPYANSFLPFCRATPYSLGEVFTYYPVGTTRPPGPARVMSLRGNLMLGVFLEDSSRLIPPGIPRADSALDWMVKRAIPLYQRVWDLSAPTTTSDESGQLLVMLEQSPSNSAGWWPDPFNGHGRWGKVVLVLDANSAFGSTRSSSAAAVFIFAHEVTHTYQFRWRYEHASPWFTYLGTAWAVEGGASLAGQEMVREYLGVPFLSNAELSGLTLDAYNSPVTDVTAGYTSSASMLRDFVQRLVQDGKMSFDDAIREVLVGALEGWYGINEEGRHVGPGLTVRMQRVLGAGWNPVDALLDWTMSQCADDLTSNPRYQNLTVRQARPSTTSNTIRRHAVIGGGNSASVVRAAGNTGVFEISDSGGGTYTTLGTVNGAPSSALQWLLLRIN